MDPKGIIKSAGFSDEEAEKLKEKFTLGIPETPALLELKAYRKALSVRKRLMKTGIEYVLFPRLDGKNIEDPRTYDKSANAWDDVEGILVARAKREIQPVLMKELRNMRNPEKVKDGNK
jgi:hypothetical protein